eukprot:SAG11_NODE_123_length_15805_cov_15.133261_1_plen_194_part_00
MRAPRDPSCGIWWPSRLKRCGARCGATNLTYPHGGLVSVRALAQMTSVGPAQTDGPHDGNNQTNQVGLATLKSADQWVGIRQLRPSAGDGIIRLKPVLCTGSKLVVGAEVELNSTLRVGVAGSTTLSLNNVVDLWPTNSRHDVEVWFRDGLDFSALKGTLVGLRFRLMRMSPSSASAGVMMCETRKFRIFKKK